jgi:hypothetical protein
MSKIEKIMTATEIVNMSGFQKFLVKKLEQIEERLDKLENGLKRKLE